MINILFGLYSLLVYQLVYASDIQHWAGGFIMLSYPLVLLGHVMFVVVWLLGRSVRFVLSFLFLIFAFPLLNRTYKFPEKDKVSGKVDFSVMSYNVMYLDRKPESKEEDFANVDGINAMMDTLHSSVVCFQELLNYEEPQEYSSLKRYQKRWKYFDYIHAQPNNNEGVGAIGLVTFSKFPIINKKEEYWGINNNGILATDILVGKDTVRILNVQLRSMGIRVQKILKSDHEIDKKETKNVYYQLKNGFTKRANQTNILEKWVKESPYPLIVAGDFNEIPYSYSYGRMRVHLDNSFEKKGKGFGFTYRKILSFLRIDNQFFTPKKLEVVHFLTHSWVPYSDHVPIQGWYRFLP